MLWYEIFKPLVTFNNIFFTVQGLAGDLAYFYSPRDPALLLMGYENQLYLSL